MFDRAAVPPVNRRHLAELGGELGIMQHAIGPAPDPHHGYCTDDVARALRVDLLHAREVGWPVVAASAARGVAFLEGAFNLVGGRFRNFRDMDGAWLDEAGSEDAHARAVLALAEASVRMPDRGLRQRAARLVDASIPACLTLRHVRPLAAAALAGDALAQGGRDPGHAISGALADALWARVGPRRDRSLDRSPDDARRSDRSGEAASAFDATGHSGLAARPLAASPPAAVGWPWPEPVLTYENGLLPQALIATGRRLARTDMLVHGVHLLDWLLAIETAPDGHVSVVGNSGWYPRGGRPAQWDQQPIEATSILLACEAAADATGAARYRDAMERCYGWFTGRNDHGIAVAIPDRGSCYDGLTATGPNTNQGAESTLMWLLAQEHVRAARRHDRSRPAMMDTVPTAGAQV